MASSSSSAVAVGAAHSSVDTAAASSTNPPVEPPVEWGNDHRHYLLFMSHLKDQNGNLILPKSYTQRHTTWSKFTTFQQKNIVEIWQKLSPNDVDTAHAGIPHNLNGAAGAAPGAAPGTGGSSNWNINCNCRLIHLFADPQLNSVYTSIETAKSRTQLDDKEARDPWDDISEAFGDVETYSYSNISVMTRDDGTKGASLHHGVLFEKAKDWDPNAIPRNCAFSVSTIKANLSKLKARYTVVMQRFGTSGHGSSSSGDYEYEFAKFTHGDDLVLYCYAAWKNVNTTRIGKILGEDVGSDTATDGEHETRPPHRVTKHRLSQPPLDNTAVAEHLNKSRKISALSFLIQFGLSDTVKERAQGELMAAAGWDESPQDNTNNAPNSSSEAGSP